MEETEDGLARTRPTPVPVKREPRRRASDVRLGAGVRKNDMQTKQTSLQRRHHPHRWSEGPERSDHPVRRAADHRPGTAHQRDAQRQKPDGVHPAIDLADREISRHGTRSIKRGYVLSGHIPFWCVYNRKSTASLSDADSSPPPHAADCNSPKLVQYRPPALNRTGNQT